MEKPPITLPALPDRQAESHKGDYGFVLIVGGARGMIGAVALAANAALRSGAGLVRLAVPESILTPAITLAPCATGTPLPEDVEGRISRKALPALLKTAQENNVLAVGPGMGQSEELTQVIADIVDTTEFPLVLDADGLNNLARADGWEGVLSDRIVLTPHPGEIRRLYESLGRNVPLDRRRAAMELADVTGAVVVLKGHKTVITDNKRTYINSTGNCGMATAGAGDVLTGCIAALIGQGMSPVDAAVAGVYLHGLAGDLAAEKRGYFGLIASDLVDCLPVAFEQYQKCP